MVLIFSGSDSKGQNVGNHNCSLRHIATLHKDFPELNEPQFVNLTWN